MARFTRTNDKCVNKGLPERVALFAAIEQKSKGFAF